MITMDLDELQQEAASAVWAHAARDEQGVLGLPMSLDGFTWGLNCPVDEISDRIDEAVAIVWAAESLRVSGRYEASTIYLRVPRPDYPNITRFTGYSVQAYASLSRVIGRGRRLVWEVTDPAGAVLIRADIDLADDIYRHTPPGSHLRQVVAAAGHLEQTAVAA